MFEQYVQQGPDSALKDHAQSTLPVLREQLKRIEELTAANGKR
ncbi:DUF4142 domain-containing protein [Neorhizobium petrolearium]